MAIVARIDLEVYQVDVQTSLLNGKLKEEMYIEKPEGFDINGKEDKA